MGLTNNFGQLVGAPVDNWQGCKKPVAQILKGFYCDLEPLEVEKHASKLFSALGHNNQGESWTYLPYGPFDTLAEFKQWLQETKSDNSTLLFAIIDKKTQQPVGVCGYLRITPEHGVIEIGHLHFSTLLQRTPAATEAIYLLLKYVFDEYAYRRCEWKCNSLNLASKAAAERYGFKFEGIFRQNFVFKDRNRDTAWYSIIDSEWTEFKNSFQQWLQPSNFDTQGKQYKKLSELRQPA